MGTGSVTIRYSSSVRSPWRRRAVSRSHCFQSARWSGHSAFRRSLYTHTWLYPHEPQGSAAPSSAARLQSAKSFSLSLVFFSFHGLSMAVPVSFTAFDVFYMQAHTADRVRRAESCSFRRMHSSVLLYVLCLAFCMKRLHVSGRLMPALRPVCVSEHLLSCLRTSTCSVFTSCLVQPSIVLYEDR